MRLSSQETGILVVSHWVSSIPLHSSVNPLIHALYTSTQDYKQQCSRLHQCAKASHQGGTTPTSPELKDQQHKWTWLLQQVKGSWHADKIEEYAQLLAAYHSVGEIGRAHV